MSQPVSLFWFRRDLRLDDNAALYHALVSGYRVLPVFVFDTNILDLLLDKSDKRVSFIYSALENIHQVLFKIGSSLKVLHGTPLECFKKLTSEYDISAVYTNHDYEPYAQDRDDEIRRLLKGQGIPFNTYKDHVIFEKDEILKENKEPYIVFTPYSRRWKEKLSTNFPESYPDQQFFHNFLKCEPIQMPALANIGFIKTKYDRTPLQLNEDIARQYHKTRDYPAIQGTTRMSVHLRFGTISIRKLVIKAFRLNATLLNELIWREFYQMILWHYPFVVNHSFKKEFDRIEWRNNESEFGLWCRGETGFPIVDAGMRQLNATGYMPNRVRMITASFLIKDLLVDWRWGEAYFAEKLLDYDLAANIGGWQWAAGSGCDAAPYFRIFNPELQTKRFDSNLQYIRQWVPEFEGFNYTQPIVDHKSARDRFLKTYKKAMIFK